MEEIIGYGIWLKKNRAMLDEKYPKISRIYENYSTEGMALAAFEELLLCLLFCILALMTKNKMIWLIWLGGFIAYAFHLLIHICQSLFIRKYIPCFITSIIVLPISIWQIYECLFSSVGMIIVALNLKFAQFLIGKFTKWMMTI